MNQYSFIYHFLIAWGWLAIPGIAGLIADIIRCRKEKKK